MTDPYAELAFIGPQPAPLPLATKRALTTRQMLAELPMLALELTMTVDAPNPSGETNQGGRAKKRSEYPAPTNLHVLDLLRTVDLARDEDRSYVPLIRIGECSRIVWQSLDPEDRAEHPQPEGRTWAGECDWLATVWPTALSVLDQCDLTWVEEEVRKIYNQFATAIRLPVDVRYVCPRYGCLGRATMQDGGQWMTCTNGHTSDIKAERGRFLSMQDWTLAQVRDGLATYCGKQVPIDTLKKWIKRGKLQPIKTDHRGVRLYNFGAVMAIANRDGSPVAS